MSSVISTIERFLFDRKNEFLEKEIAQEIKDKKQKYEQLLESSKSKESNNEKIALEKQKLEEAILKAKQKKQPLADEKYEIKTWCEYSAA